MFGLFETVNAIKMATFSIISLAHISIELSLITIRPGESFEQSANIVDGLNRECSSRLIDNIFPLFVVL